MGDARQSIFGPTFRWKVAERHARRQGWWSPHSIDDLTRDAAEYLGLCNSEDDGLQRATQVYPLIAAAIDFLAEESAAEQFKVLVLAGVTDGEIAERLRIDEAIIETARLLFCDVEGMRQSSSWINCHLIRPEIEAGNLELAAKMRMAVYGGPVMAESILNAQDDLPADQGRRLVDQEMLVYAKMQAALRFPLTAENSLEFLKLSLDHDIALRKLQLEREKFQHEVEMARQSRKTGDEFTQTEDANERVNEADSTTGSSSEKEQRNAARNIEIGDPSKAA